MLDMTSVTLRITCMTVRNGAFLHRCHQAPVAAVMFFMGWEWSTGIEGAGGRHLGEWGGRSMAESFVAESLPTTGIDGNRLESRVPAAGARSMAESLSTTRTMGHEWEMKQMKNDKKVVMFDSDEAASLQSVTGWVSRGGFFHGDGGAGESAARYAGCTHRACPDCGTVIEKSRTACGPCLLVRMRKRFEGFEKREWDGVTPIALFMGDTYFWEEQELVDFCCDEEVDPAGLLLVLCRPGRRAELDAVEFLSDFMADDGRDIPPEILDAERAFNKAAKAAELQVWYPMEVAVVLPADVLASIRAERQEACDGAGA